jgi:alpha-L-fucosidase 2
VFGGVTQLANFKGGMFRVDPKLKFYGLDFRHEPATPDDQFYGNRYWWQNMRFLYEPQSAQGNFDFYRSY